MDMIPEGVYPAKIAGYGVRVTKAGDASPTIVFDVTDTSSDKKHRVFWQGTFKANSQALDIAVETLLICGLKNLTLVPKLPLGPAGGVLDMDKPLEVNVIHEYDPKDESKVYPRVKWVNEVSGIKNKISEQEFAPLLAGLNIEATIMSIAAEKGYKLEDGKTAPRPSPLARGSLDDLPF